MVDSIEKKSYESKYKSGFIKTVWAVLTVLLLLAVFAVPASAETHTHTINPSDSLADAIKNAETGDIIVLNTGTYDIDRQIVISDKNVTLKTNADVFINKNFDYIGDDDGIFKVNTTDGRLILEATSGVLTVDGMNKGRMIYVSEGAEFIMRADGVSNNILLYNGTVINDGSGGAVYVTGQHSLFSLYGGFIQSNHADFSGGAVEVQNGATFNMYGGMIGGVTSAYNNTANRGVIQIGEHATFNMYGGKISHNKANMDGGGVKCWGTFNMYDGEISNNSVESYGGNSRGGGVFLQRGSRDVTFNMYGGKISCNTVEDRGGGVFAGNSDGTTGPVINIYNGTISDNEAGSGGGVYIDGGTTLNIYNGTISDNNATAVSFDYADGGGGVVVSGVPSTTLTKLNMYGGNISHNKATNGICGGVLILNYTASTIHGGNISDNIGNNAVVIDKGTGDGIDFKMYGGTISNSTASPDVMKVEGAGTIDFKMYGGIIIGERTDYYGSASLEIGKAVNEVGNKASGFNNKSDGSGINMINKFVDSEPIYTIYSGSAETKTVSFNGNGGSGSTDSITIPTDSALTLNGFTKTGYSFDVWKQQRTGIRFIDTQPITYSSFGSDVSGTETLDAQWKPNEYDITYNVNGGTKIIGPEYGSVIYDSIVRSMPKASKPMYTFTGWNTVLDGTGNFVLSSTIYNFTASNTILYANYTGNTTILNFTTYGTSTQPDINVNYDSLVEPITPPTNPGYNFSGYFIGDNATGKQLYKYDGTVNTSLDGYTDASGKWTNSSLPHGSTVNLFAKWTANVVTLNFTTYSASIQTNITARYNETKLVNLTIPTNSGYNFGGYFIGDNATGKQLYNETGFVNTLLSDYVDASGNWTNSSIVNGETVYLFAKWTATPVPAPTSPAPTSPAPTPTPKPTPKPTQPVSSGGSSGVVYGYLTYEVFFDSMGGSNVDSISNLLNGAIIKEPVPPTKDGNTFDGWYTKEGHKWDFPTDTVTKTLTLYAKWTSTSASTHPVSTGASTTEQTNSPLGLVGLGLGLLGAAAILRRK